MEAFEGHYIQTMSNPSSSMHRTTQFACAVIPEETNGKALQ